MAHQLERLGPGQSHTFGGTSIDYIKIGPVQFGADVVVQAIHRGSKSGAGSPASRTARVELWLDGEKFGEQTDSGFDNYNVSVTRNIVLAAGASIAVRSINSNTSAVTTFYSLTAKFTRQA